MANSDFQRHSFLGGEVSPALYERCDMDKFGRWFAKAENIRFYETGGFRNRPGFVKIANTKNNAAGQKIKLISFSFNDEESFLVEFGAGYARFFKNGQPIMDGSSPYEITTPFLSFSENDIKYAQAGDTIFITHPQYGIYELIRQNIEGTSWLLRKFKADILPMGEMNDVKTDTVTLAESEDAPGILNFSLQDPDDTNAFYNPSLSFEGDSTYNYSLSGRVTHQTFVDSFNGQFSESGVAMTISSDNVITVVFDDLSASIISGTFEYEYEKVMTSSSSSTTNGKVPTDSTSNVWKTAASEPSVVIYVPLTAKYVSKVTSYYEYYNAKIHSTKTQYDKKSKEIATNKQAATSFTIAASITDITEQKSYLSAVGENGVSLDACGGTELTENTNYIGSSTWPGIAGISKTLSVSYVTTVSDSITRPFADTSEGKYVLTFSGDENADFLSAGKIEIGDTILLMNSVDEQSWSAKLDSPGSTWTSGPSNGKWRTYSLGNWKGNVLIEYSTDNKQTWTDYFKWQSEDKDNYPYNISTSGTVNADDSVFFRVTATVTEGNLKIFFSTDNYLTNSYYLVKFIAPDSSFALVDPIKNDVGEVTANYRWRLPAFSSYEGYPQSIGFYQNRLFFAKDYILYGSKTNDFWDFYESVSLQADDPVTMSLLSTKANIIRNLVTQRSFFVFTSGGEYGIGSEGALTQSDKYLKAFSSNGSNPCLPVLISDVVLFVDKSANSVRALKYSLESDGYEAPDITLMLRALLEQENFITTDTIFEDKEALFLSDAGTIWVLKYITDQNVLSWSHWKHANGKIVNICVVPNGAKHDLYIVVEKGGEQLIEKMQEGTFLDTVQSFDATEASKVSVTGAQGEEKTVIQDGRVFKKVIDTNGQIDCPPDSTKPFEVGNTYTSTATLLSPTFQVSENAAVNYEKKAVFKVFFYYINSHGFKIGVDDSEKMQVEWQPVTDSIDEEHELTSGKKSVLIPSSFNGSSMLSFVQEEPYPMIVHDVLVQTDYGGK